jgi:23S rRNA (adenine2503-C2)-methyltransferase
MHYINEMERFTLPKTTHPRRRGVLDMTPSAWETWLQGQGQPKLRARQIRRWVIAGRASAFEQMTDLPLPLRQQLAAELAPFSTTIHRHLVSSDGTEKLLLQLHDGNLVECVLLKEADRRTVCISTQVGCGMGCVFCASGMAGVVRNLTAAEILEQLLHARNLLPPQERLTHIVVMGMGEPLANLDSLFEALAIATHCRNGSAIPSGGVVTCPQRCLATPDRAHQRGDWHGCHSGGG